MLLYPAAYALDVAHAELARVLVKRAGGSEQANPLLDEAEALVRGVLAHDAEQRPPRGLVHPQRTAAVFDELPPPLEQVPALLSPRCFWRRR